MRKSKRKHQKKGPNQQNSSKNTQSSAKTRKKGSKRAKKHQKIIQTTKNTKNHPKSIKSTKSSKNHQKHDLKLKILQIHPKTRFQTQKQLEAPYITQISNKSVISDPKSIPSLTKNNESLTKVLSRTQIDPNQLSKPTFNPQSSP